MGNTPRFHAPTTDGGRKTSYLIVPPQDSDPMTPAHTIIKPTPTSFQWGSLTNGQAIQSEKTFTVEKPRRLTMLRGYIGSHPIVRGERLNPIPTRPSHDQLYLHVLYAQHKGPAPISRERWLSMSASMPKRHYVNCVPSESAFVDEAKRLVRAEVGPPRTTIRED